MECLSCHSENIKRNGSYKTYQRYKCKNCGRQFSERSLNFFCRHRFPEKVIRNSILYGVFVSTRNVTFIAKETMNVQFSNVTSYNWSKKFAKLIDKLQYKIPLSNISSIWHVDEKFIKIGKKQSYLWVVIDSNNNILAVHVSMSRDIKSAKQVLRLARKNADLIPGIIVTDGLQAYKKACKIFGRKVKHVTAHFETVKFMHKGVYYMLSNNRIESLNSKINLWYKKSRGFKKLENARLWCRMWMHFYNYIRPRVIEHETISFNEALVLCEA